MTKTKTEMPVSIPDGEIDWLEMAEPPKEFQSHTYAPHVSFRSVKPMRILNLTEPTKII